MPPKKAAKKAAAPAAPPLTGCTIALSGTFPGRSQTAVEQELINPLGASLSKTVNASTTHLVTTDADFAKLTAKVKQAQSHDDIPIVNLAWLEDCLDQSTRLTEIAYVFSTTTSALAPTLAVTTNGNGKANDTRKRTLVSNDDADDDDTQPKKRAKGKATTANGSNAQSQDTSKPVSASGIKSELKSEKVKQEVDDGKINVAKSTDINIPIDEACPLSNYWVYIDGEGVIHDASLNQTNASNNNNKFYRLQLLQSATGDYQVWTRWGRVGERGQNAILSSGSLDDALRQYDSKFKSKSGLAWSDRGGNPKSGKYTFIERSYEPDSDEEENDTKVKKVKTEEGLEAPESKLAPAIQNLMELIFNQQYFAATMTDLNYDVKKMPLGKLSKSTIIRGYQALKDLSALLDDPDLAREEHGTTFAAATEQLSNSFYSLIPHAFGRDRPPIIQDHNLLKREIDLLDSLGDMKDAANIMKREPKDVERINVLDRHFKGLNMDEMTPLKKDSQEFLELKDYLVYTKGATHNANYSVSEIFRIERQGEKERFEKSAFAGPPRDRRLLWHGSRCTNFGGILSQGLRIAPPEAPVSGYMFGKGIYLADMSSKSANYCCASISGGNALLLLCEAELGDPMHTLTNSSYTAGEDAKAKGLMSTWGQGRVGPSKWKDGTSVHPSLNGIKLPDVSVKPGDTNVNNAWLQYNEYITYDIAQVRLRYLFRVRM